MINKSFKLNTNNILTEAAYGELNSVRPDFYNERTGHCVDIKNYTITTVSGRNNLVNNVNSWGDFWNIFIPKNSKKCRAELSSEVYYNSIRPKAADRNALEDLKQFLMFKYL